MIVDSSALISIILDEPAGETMLRAFGEATSLKISAATWFETHLVVDNLRSGKASQGRLTELLAILDMQIVAVDQDLARDARDAHLTYNRGHHPARLNFGDCFSYALAKQTGEPLLFKGNDFSQTDIVSALA